MQLQRLTTMLHRSETLNDRLTGALLGTAVGDAIGLPREGLSARRAARIFGGSPLHHRFIFSRGMCSDDTEHACMIGQALLASGGDPELFVRSFAWRLRFWLLGFPAGAGYATLRSALKLWLGVSPYRSGARSAGNGAAMRAALIGIYAAGDTARIRTLVRLSSRITHADERAEWGALAVAIAAAYGSLTDPEQITPTGYLDFAGPVLGDTAIWPLLQETAAAVSAESSFETYLRRIGCSEKVSGFVNHTVPAAVFCWLSSPADFRTAVERVVLAGGDSDTTGAITGALVGSSAGESSIPAEWINGLLEWPRGPSWMRRLARELSDSALSDGRPRRATALCWPALPLRNLLFLAAVLFHGIRRVLPPY